MALRMTGLLRVGRACQFHRPIKAVYPVQQRSVSRFVTFVNSTWDGAMAKLKGTDAYKRLRRITGFDQPVVQLGDYPRLPAISNQELPTYGWWDNFECRNKNTIIHESYDSLSVWMFDIYPIRNQEDTRLWVHVLNFFLTVFGFYAFYKSVKLAMKYAPVDDFVQKRYPHGNLYVERGGDTTYPHGYFPSGPAFSSDPVPI